MHKPSPQPQIFNSLTEASPTGYARPVEEFDPEDVSQDHYGNLQALLEMLLDKRRSLVQDVMLYRMTYAGRAQDIAKIQPVIEAVERAMEHEKRLAGNAR